MFENEQEKERMKQYKKFLSLLERLKKIKKVDVLVFVWVTDAPKEVVSVIQTNFLQKEPWLVFEDSVVFSEEIRNHLNKLKEKYGVLEVSYFDCLLKKDHYHILEKEGENLKKKYFSKRSSIQGVNECLARKIKILKKTIAF